MPDKKILMPILFLLAGVVFADKIRALPLLNKLPVI